MIPRTLKARLTLVAVSATFLGLLVMAVTCALLLNRGLTSRVDEKLGEMSMPWESGDLRPPDLRNQPPPPDGIPSDFRILIFDRAGHRVAVVGQSASNPGIPRISGPPADDAIRSAPDTRNGSPWRVRGVRLKDGTSVVLALSLASVRTAVAQLATIEAAVGGTVMGLLAVFGVVLTRRSLRPLARIEVAAEAIAGGDLARRIPQADPRSEPGRLGLALNAMVARLIDALRQRESSEQKLRRFVDDASHELRTPLTSIRGFAELSRRVDAPSPEELGAMMARIESEAIRMSRLVDDMLDLAKLDRAPIHGMNVVDLCSVVRDVVHDSTARNPERDISAQVPDHPVVVTGDEDRIRQVVTNLANNAMVHASDTSPIVVTTCVGRPTTDPVATSESGDPAVTEDVAVVGVFDQGPGVPEFHAQRIFDRFYQARESRTGRGAGLGLAIAGSIAAAHGGRIELHGNRFGGSTFLFVIPLHEGYTPEAPPQSAP